MQQFLELMKLFEKRNNISIFFEICSDGSCHFEEFWKAEILGEFGTIDKAIEFLEDTEYELDENGLCFSPVRIKNQKP